MIVIEVVPVALDPADMQNVYNCQLIKKNVPLYSSRPASSQI